MNVLCTGGAGFIGSNLIERLSKMDSVESIVSVDNYSTGSKNNHIESDKVIYLNESTSRIKYLDFGQPVDLIFHLGEYSRVEQSFEDLNTVFDSNTVGTFEVVKYAKSVGAKLIYAGSSTKFGDIGENSSPYAFSKAQNTKFVKNFSEWYNLNYAIVYFYNVYGKREISTGKYATLIAKFLDMAKRGEKVIVTSPGTQVRNFTNVDDTVDALLLIAASGQGDDYGIGSDQLFSVLDVVKMIGCEWDFGEHKRGNRMSASVICDKTKALGWAPKRSLRDYINQEMGK